MEFSKLENLMKFGGISLDVVLLTKSSTPIIGWFAEILGFIMNLIFDLGITNIGVAIIIFTLVINIIMIPLTINQQKSQKLMAVIQPEIKAIQDKYKGKTDNESAMGEIHSRAENNLMEAIKSCAGYCRNPEIIVVSLVLIAMLEYNGNYYDSVRETYKVLYKKFSEQKVEGKIRSILSKYKKQSDSGKRTRIINVALENAIVPQAYLSAFFEFVFDIYKLNFEYDLPEEPYEEFQFVFDGLRNNVLSDGDDISINVTQKTYKLIAATKQLISREDGLDAVIKLSIIIVKLIDQRFWDKEVKIFNPYLKTGYEGWEKTLKESARGGYERKKNDSELRSRWEPKFVMLNNSVYLNPPAHKVKSQYDYRDIAVVVLNDGEELYRNNNCDIREIIGGYQVNTEIIEIIKPLGKLTYRLVVGNEAIYDSREKLYRNCIVFNNEPRE